MIDFKQNLCANRNIANLPLVLKQEIIESFGGKVSSSVSKRQIFCVNRRASRKQTKKANDLGVKILSRRV